MKKHKRQNAKQLMLGNEFKKCESAFGGSLLKGNNPKHKRPLDSKLPVHLVLRSSLAIGEKSLRRGRREELVRKTIERTAKKYGIRVYQYANAGNHLHILLKLNKRFLWKAFICELTGRIASLVMGYRKMAQNLRQKTDKPQKFWDYRPFTRVVHGWGRSYRIAKDYVTLNILESLGILSRRDQNWHKNLAMRFETG